MATNYQNSASNRQKFAPWVTASELKHGIPSGMLDKLLMAESAYRDDIISGVKKSSVGALGIAQFMPATAKDLGVDPLDPYAAIDAAGRYLAMIYGWTGRRSWTHAVAAYNWGAGNVNRVVSQYGPAWLSYTPTETKAYVARILNA